MPELLSLRRPICHDIGPQACEQKDQHRGPRPVRGWSYIDWPLIIDLTQIEISPDGQGEACAFERNESERTPPHRTARAKSGSGKLGYVLDPALPHSSSSGVSFGQNHPTNAIATGIDPHTTAHGVKIDARKVAPTAIAARSGQIEGAGELSRCCGKASVTVPEINSRESTLRPVTTGNVSRLSQSGSRWVTNGIRLKL